MHEVTLCAPGGLDTVVQAEGLQLRLERLFGFACAATPEEPEIRGLFALKTSAGDGDASEPLLRGLSEGQATMAATFEAGALMLETVWTLDTANLVLSRCDRITNSGVAPVTLNRCQARFPLAPGGLELYAQRGHWGRESQGGWVDLPAAELVLEGFQGRSAIPAPPYLFFRRPGGGPGVALHVLPRGNWTIRVARRGGYYDGKPCMVIEAGLADGALALVLAPGATLELPELLLQGIPGGEPHLGAAPLHTHAWRRWFAKAKPSFPVQYNTWFDRYDNLDVDHLRAELAAAKEVGCEVFTVDAGWFGYAAGSWDGRVGDWRETADRSFKGKMRDFAGEVRAAGLRFGLWMEAERVVPTAPIAKSHPEWLAPAGHKAFRVAIEEPAAYAYLKGEMSRVVETYDLAWMKIDSNFPLGLDECRGELTDYYTAWFRLLGELRAKFPGCVFEACASGGLRMDLELTRQHEGIFLSDNVTPNDMIRMIQGSALRVPPARMTLWTVIKSLPDRGLVAARIHGFDDPIPVDMDFATLVCMPGIFVLSGDLESLPLADRTALAARVAWYKRWREFIVAAATDLLTPPAPMEDHTGWAALQLRRADDSRSLVFAYRLDDRFAVRWIPLRNLDPRTRYALAGNGVSPAEATGAELMDRGLRVELPARFRATVVEVVPVS
ncbi:MAG: alpha-galactosidase [Candidatus Coatesbacteria bacterium]